MGFIHKIEVGYPKGGGIVWTFVKNNIIKENEDCEAIKIHGFDYKIF